MIGTAFFDDNADQQLRSTLQRLLVQRFGPLRPGTLAKLAARPTEQLSALAEALLTAKSLQELGLDEATFWKKG